MSLRLFLDEDIKSKRLVRLLKEAGHDVATTADLGIDGHEDRDVLGQAIETDRVVLTYNCDDFRRLHEADASHPGVVLVYQEPGKSLSHERIVRALDNLERSGAPLAGSLYALNAWDY